LVRQGLENLYLELGDNVMTMIYNNKQQIVGETRGNTYYKVVNRSLHFMRKFDGWGCDVSILESLKSKDIKFVVIKVENEESIYTTTVDFWLESGIRREYGSFGAQSFLPQSKFLVENYTAPVKDIKRIEELNKMPYKIYLQTFEWDETRKLAYKRANNKCENCGDTKDLNVHHLTYENLGNERPEDLKVLCSRCHREIHKIGELGNE